eukprot:TRINITY_DN28756_c0_g1_i1.p1 TRINITY_DN28756_c0_g1~~TRINITY_DN28756_c0_g1_i1.p1  ORF type:complete len:225 (-),score=8.53 TRINITY_DN28756_c0_g1_i1:211-885(-)
MAQMRRISQLVTQARQCRGNMQKLFGLKDAVLGLTANEIPHELLDPQHWQSDIKVLAVDETQHYTMMIWVLREGAQLPLHNHPGMNVYFKPLAGHLHVEAYEWVEPEPEFDEAHTTAADWLKNRTETDYEENRPAKLVYDRVLTPEEHDTTLLEVGPNLANLHQITADSDAAFFDLIFPPYKDNQRGQDCTYFQVGPKQYCGKRNQYFLSPIRNPQDLVFNTAK